MGDEPVEHDPRDGEAARPEDSTAWQDATLRRPALDPAIPRAARDLLRARGDLLAPAPPDLGRRRSLLPASGERREAMVSNAVTGLSTALFFTRLTRRVLIPALAEIAGTGPPPGSPLRQADRACKAAIADLAAQASPGIQPPATKRRSRQAPVVTSNPS